MLTRAGRLAATLLTVTVFIGTATLALAAHGGPAVGASSSGRAVVVASGETLSSIAAANLPQVSLSEGVHRIQVANRMSTDRVIAGQRLIIPAG